MLQDGELCTESYGEDIFQYEQLLATLLWDIVFIFSAVVVAATAAGRFAQFFPRIDHVWAGHMCLCFSLFRTESNAPRDGI